MKLKKANISLAKKYIVVGTIGLLAVVFTFTIINTHFQNKNLRDQYLREAKNLIKLVEFRAAEQLDALQINRLRENIHFIKQNHLVKEIIIFNNEQMIITDGQIDSDKKFSILADPLIEQSLNNDSLVYKISDREIALYLPIDLSYRRLGGVKLIYSLTELRRTEISILFNNLKYAGIVFVVGLILMLMFIRKIVKPIKELIHGTEEVSMGNYDERIVIKTRDELELLANSFNDMVKSLKLSRDEIIAAKEKAEKSDKLKSEFLAQMSHEIRTPVNAIVNFTELLKVDLEHKMYGDTKDAFDIIELSSDRLIRTIDLILNMSEIQSGNFQPHLQVINLYTEVLKPVHTEFKYKAKAKSLELILENSTEESSVRGDRYSLVQMFTNLVDNAIKYTENGDVKMSIEVGENNKIITKIKDSGIGISEEFLPFLFEPFMQEESGYSRRFEGTGLGLSLVKRYGEINNAEVKVESEKNKGTTFIIIFESLTPKTVNSSDSD